MANTHYNGPFNSPLGAVLDTDTDASGFSFVIDEDNMASASAVKLPTQQSVKAYADTKMSATIPVLGADLDVSEKTIDLGGAPSADHISTGITITLTAGETVAIGDAVYFKSDGKVWKSDADAIATMPVIGIVTEAITAETTGKILTHGIFRDDTWAWTVGGKVFASLTAGGLTQTIPSGAEDIVQVVGIALSADVLFVSPSLDTAELL